MIRTHLQVSVVAVISFGILNLGHRVDKEFSSPEVQVLKLVVKPYLFILPQDIDLLHYMSLALLMCHSSWML